MELRLEELESRGRGVVLLAKLEGLDEKEGGGRMEKWM